MRHQSFSKASFLGVATEIRFRIYHYVFQEPKVVINLERGRGNTHEASGRYSTNVISDFYNNAITQINTRVRSEALTHLHRSTALILLLRCGRKSEGLPLEVLPAGLLGDLRRVSLHVDLIRGLPIEDLKSLECVSIRWAIHIEDEQLMSDNRLSENLLRGLIVKYAAQKASRWTGKGDLAMLQRRLKSRARKVQVLWSCVMSRSSFRTGCFRVSQSRAATTAFADTC